MKKICFAFLIVALCLGLCACVSNDSSMSGDTVAGTVGTSPMGTIAPTMPAEDAAPMETIAPTMPATKPVEEVAPTEETMPATEPVEEVAPTEGTMPATEPVEEVVPTEGTMPATDPVEGTESKPTQGNTNVEENTTPAGCNHSFSKATCQKPATCSLCGETKGELADHSFNKSGCTVCGAENPARSGIAKALKAIERYPKYIKINKELIENEYDLFKSTGDLKYFNDAHKHTLEIHDYLKTVAEKCQDYADDDFWIGKIVEDCQECVLEMPIVPTSTGKSDIRSYISKCKTYATKAERIFAVYDNLCEDYGVQ